MKGGCRLAEKATRFGVWSRVLQVTVLGLSVALASCSSLRIQRPLEYADSDWPTDGRTGMRDRYAIDEPVRLPLEESWIYNAAAGFSSGSPLVVSDHVFVATRKGEIHVLDLTTGDKVGKTEFGLSIEGAPALRENTLFVPNAWGKDALTAFDLIDGVTLWKHRGIPIEAPVLLTDESVLAADVEGNVIKLDSDDGTIQWVYDFGEIVTVFSGPTEVGEDRVVVASEMGHIVCLDIEDGQEVWSLKLDAPVEASLAADENSVYVPTTRGRLYALETATGRTRWIYHSDEETVRFAGAALAPQYLVFGGSDGVLRSVNKENGSTRWTFQTDGTFASPPAISGDLVFVGAMDRQFFAISLDDGSMQWSTKLRGRVKSAPAVRDGHVVVLSEPRYVYAFTHASSMAGL
jgi:outer membrane protein assembly factor BamB